MGYVTPVISRSIIGVLLLLVILGSVLFPSLAFAIPDDGNRGVTIPTTAANTSNSAGSPSSLPTFNPDTSVLGPGNAGFDATYTQQPASNAVDAAKYANQLSINTFHGAIIYIGGWLTGMAGNVFEYSFDLFIVRLGCFFTNENTKQCGSTVLGGEPGAIGGIVNTLWQIVRDLFNLALIFALIYAGFKLILNADDTSARKTVSGVIIAGLLVNFSLYIAKLLVDITNFTALQIYSHMAQGTGTYGIENAFDVGSTYGGNIAGSFMTVLKIASWFNTTVDGGTFSAISFALLALIFLLLLAGVFFYSAFMMMTRFIAIVILLIFSPAMFLGYVLPQFGGYSKKWREMFVAYCMYAPAYTFMLYLSLFVMIQFSNSFAKQSYGAAFTKNGEVTADTMGIFVFFFIGIGFLIASTKVAGMMANAGAGGTMKMAHNFANKLTTGALVRGGQMGGGYFARAVSGFTGSKVTGVADKWESASGKSSRVTRGLRLAGDNMKNKKYFGVDSYKTNKDNIDKADKQAARGHEIANLKSSIKKGAGSDEFDAQVEMETAVRNAPNPQIVDMAKSKSGMAALTSVAGSLSSNQLKAINDSADISDTAKKELNAAHGKAITNKIKGYAKPETQGDTERMAEGLKSASADEIDSLDMKTDVLPYAMQLQTKQMDGLKKKWGEDSAKFKKLKQEQERLFNDAAQKNDFRAIISSRKGNKEIAQLPKDILETSGFVTALSESELSADLLGNIARESGADKKLIGGHIIERYGSFENLPPDVKNFMLSGSGAVYLTRDALKKSSANTTQNQAAFNQRAAAARASKNKPTA